MRSKCQKKNKRAVLPMIMIGFNILISIAAVCTFGYYVNGSQKLVHDVALQGVMDLSADMTRQLERDMTAQHNVLVNIADYIMAMELNEEKTLVYLEHMNNLKGFLMLIDPENYQGYEIVQQAEELKTGKRKSASVSEIEDMKEVCIKCRMGEEDKFPITDIFQRDGEDKNVIAFYRSVTLDGQKRVLFYVIDIKEVIKDIIGEYRMITEPGLLIDADGMVLFYGDDEKDSYPVNFYDYQELYFGKKDSDDIRAIFSSKQYGNFVQRDDSGREWMYTYSHLGEDLDSSWIYINRVDNKELENNGTLTWPLVLMALFMSCPWLINVGVICWQNARLRRRQCMIEETNVQLEAANKAQVTFISNMSHEIRTPINAVLGMDEMIIRETSEEEIREYAYNIKSAGKTLLGIINDILDFTKIEAGKMDIIPQEYELSSVINDLLNMIDTRVKEKGLEFKLNLNKSIPHTLYGDELRIKQIILNILTNAVKYTEKGSVSFNLDYEKLDEENIFLFVSIRDTGIGIKPEEMEKLNRPFERLDEKRNRTIEGTGLGMSIVTSLLLRMGSKLEIESTYGVGSRFFFRLKQKVVSWDAMGDLEKKYKETKEDVKEDRALFHAVRANILVVDDTPVNLTVVKGLLKRTGVNVETAESGMECLMMCSKKQYHVILLDHRMPEMDGIETLHQLKETDGPNKNTPVIALTANAISGAYESYMKEGFSDFLPKPVSGNKLERMIVKYLSENLLDTEEDLMTGIDDKEGIKACGSAEVYAQVCKEFAVAAKKNIQELQALYEQGDIKNYTIKVHALKSSARLVGAAQLSKEAAFLETCGNEGWLEEIEEKTPKILEYYQGVAGKLLALYNKQQEEDKPVMALDSLKEALSAMLEFSQAFDFDQVDAILKQLEASSLPSDVEERMDELKTAVYDVNQEAIEKIIREYLGGNHE